MLLWVMLENHDILPPSCSGPSVEEYLSIYGANIGLLQQGQHFFELCHDQKALGLQHIPKETLSMNISLEQISFKL